jgi:hypothetical protein
MIALAMGFFGVPAMAFSDSARPATIPDRQQNQRERIQDGVEDGDLTKREAARLRQRSRTIQNERRDARRDDGRIDRHERREITRDQNDLGRRIYRQKHDAQER